MSSKAKTTETKEEARPAPVPKLRFPEFRAAEGWAPEPMGEVYSFKGNNSLSRDKLNYVAGSVKNIHYGDIHTKFSTHFDITKELVPFINASEEGIVRDENLCAEGDMIFADASEDLADIGKSIEIVRLNGERVVSGLHTILARRIGESIALGFGGHLFKSGWVRTQIQKEAQGAKVLGISPTRLRNLRLPLPHDKAEQQKIAECLSSVDELMATQARKVDALKTHKKGLMQQLFPREGETQPRLRFPEFQNAGEWEETELGQCLEKVIDYRGKPPPKAESGVPLITAKNVRFGWLDMTADEYIEADAYDSWMTKGIPKARDILFTTEAPLANVAMFPNEGKFALGQRIITLRCKTTKCVPEFLFQSLLGPEMQGTIDFHSTGSTAKGIKSSVFVTLSFRHPKVPEQHRIASCLSSLDALITAETQKLEALKTHKKGLMQQLFPTLNETEA